MCFGGGASKQAKQAAAEQAAREEKRRKNIAAGTQAIDESLMPFNDAYFTGRQEAYTNNARPKLDDKFNDAYKNLIYSLSGNNLLQSSVGANKIRDLNKERADYETQIASEAQNFSNQGRSDLENTRSTLLSQLYATEDPSQTTAAAARQASLLNAPPVFDAANNFAFNAAQGLATANQSTGGQGLLNAITKNMRNNSSVKTTRVR